MDALLIWNAAVWTGFFVTVYMRTRPRPVPPKSKGRNLPKWMADMTTYPEPLDGYRDPIFDTSPMELDRAKH